MIIGICGYKGSGKSTVCEAATNLDDGWCFERMGFADPMYDMMKAVIPHEILYDKSLWNHPLEVLCGKTLRHAMVTLGTEWGRDHIGEDFWTNIALTKAKRIDKNATPVIDNVRFPSEAEALTNAGGFIIAFHRDGHDTDLSHSSEQYIAEIQSKYANASFTNSGHDLAKDASNFLKLLQDVTDGKYTQL